MLWMARSTIARACGMNATIALPVAVRYQARRPGTLADGSAEVAAQNDVTAAVLPPDRFVDLMRALGPDGRHVRFFNADGNPITRDRLHLTQYGARFVARRLRAAGSPALALIEEAQSASAGAANESVEE